MTVETPIVLREMLDPRVVPAVNRPDVPLVLRIYDCTLGGAVSQRFGFENVRSTVDLAAPWFIGTAMGLHMLRTFSVGQRSLMIGGVRVDAASELDGLRMVELSTQFRVIVIVRREGSVELHPRREDQLMVGDTAYLVGPYRELLATLRKGQPARHADTRDERIRTTRAG